MVTVGRDARQDLSRDTSQDLLQLTSLVGARERAMCVLHCLMASGWEEKAGMFTREAVFNGRFSPLQSRPLQRLSLFSPR